MNQVAVLVVVNAVVYTWCLHWLRYERLWLAALGALLLGPLIWLWWGYIRWRDPRRAVE